jgi:ribonucleoside-triphosphate reductase
MAEHQNKLQLYFTGGTVMHLYLDGEILGRQAKSIIQTLCRKYKLPYISLSPLIRRCPEHGFVSQREDTCPICGGALKYQQRITGYIRDVDNFNIGKKAEFKDRKQLC